MNFFNYESQFKIKKMIFPFFSGGRGGGEGRGLGLVNFLTKNPNLKKKKKSFIFWGRG